MSAEQSGEIVWDTEAKAQFERLIAKVPVFLRSTAEEKVAKRAAILVAEDKRNAINEKDMVDAFFIETPFGFHGPLKCDMEELNIDYIKYGHPK